eukprot:g4536.t1
MGSFQSNLFPDPTTFPGGVNCGYAPGNAPPSRKLPEGPCTDNAMFGNFQVVLLTFFYAAILFNASNMISSGSEKLLWIPSWRGLVGTVVLPILGAVPDGAIVLFSAMGENPQEELSVGVGALAGSTIMLLSLALFGSIYVGRVDIDNAKKAYTKNPKLSRQFDIWETGVVAMPEVRSNANILILTAVSFLFIQGAAFGSGSHGLKHASGEEIADATKVQRPWVLVSALSSGVMFLAYLWQMYRVAGAEDNHVTQETSLKLAKAIKKGEVSVVVLFLDELSVGYHASSPTHRARVNRNRSLLEGLVNPLIQSGNQVASYGASEEYDAMSSSNVVSSGASPVGSPLLGEKDHKSLTVASDDIIASPTPSMLKNIVKQFFHNYDQNNDGTINMQEFAYLLNDIGHPTDLSKLDSYFKLIDKNGDKAINFREFIEWLPKFIRDFPDEHLRHRSSKSFTGEGESKAFQHGISFSSVEDAVDMPSLADDIFEHDEEEEEDDEPGERFLVWSEKENRMVVDHFKVKKIAFQEMLLGTALVLLFSDPICTTLSNLGTRSGIPPFYIAFVVAPLASNASELLASIYYAGKKTRTTITVALTALEGAAIMNNTFCLFIFCVIIYVKNLRWTFTAETLSILIVEIVVFFIAKQNMPSLASAIIALLLYPLSIAFIVVMENVLGYD